MQEQTNTDEVTITWVHHVLLALFSILTPLCVGLSVSTLWGWYMVPTGYMTITVTQGVGLYLLSCVLKWRAYPSCCEESTPVYEFMVSLATHWMVALVALGLGWVFIRVL